MDRSTSFFAATTVVASVVAIYLWQELRTERTRHAQPGLSAQAAPMHSGAQEAARAPALETPNRQEPLHQAGLSSVPSAAAQDASAVLRMCDSLKSRIRQTWGQAVPQQWLDALQLSPAEGEQVLELQARQVGMTTGLAECGDGTPINGLEFAAAMRDLLGPVRYDQYLDQQAVSTAQMNMNTLRVQVANLGAPLTDDQAARLNEIIIAENRRSRQEANVRAPSREERDVLAAGEEELELTRQRFERILAAARPLLKPEQFKQLETNMQRQIAQIRSTLDQRRQRIETGGALVEGR